MENSSRIRQCIKAATHGFVGREQLAELIILAAIAKEHLLVIGPPGTAKSAVVRRMAKTMNGQYFEYLLGRFTEPSELFGTVDLQKLREGTVETDTSGMLPEAEIVFLDEVFLGSTAILNTLLGILNERQFRRGHTQIACPLKICIGASNSLPEDEGLAAFADRFLLHLFIDPVADNFIEDMLAGGWQAEYAEINLSLSLDELADLSEQVKNVNLDKIFSPFADAIRLLRQNNINLSDRRVVKTLKLIAAAALVNGRLEAEKKDLWPLFYVLPTIDMQQRGQEILKDVFTLSNNSQLFYATESATQQPNARSERLIELATYCINNDDTQIESVLREIDANYTAGTVPEQLKLLRAQLIDLITKDV
ncbi:AAA family ATPase [Gilliamella sp. Pas-s25]|uniref:AAA family ATPase n=1 Tax=Gilliamella sp. Pas-s25 TaxID=2687310 RepID=UPI00135E1A40|nr:AAA family ATPase [Gilliamella sp. Pas-s25]MWP62960.1 AAA domain-containing protein [Gilliamella sp. Pas-s25]